MEDCIGPQARTGREEGDGPLDLLLRRAEEDPLSLVAVALAEILIECLRPFLRDGPEARAGRAEEGQIEDEPLALEDLARLMVLGARLLQMKSRALLVPPGQTQDAEGPSSQEGATARGAPEEADLGPFRELALFLRQRAEAGLRSYQRPAPSLPPARMAGVALEALTAAFLEALSRQQPEPSPPPDIPQPVARETLTLQGKLEEIRAHLKREGQMSFGLLMASCRSRREVVVSFLAILELMKRGELQAEQPEPFADIILKASDSGPNPMI